MGHDIPDLPATASGLRRLRKAMLKLGAEVLRRRLALEQARDGEAGGASDALDSAEVLVLGNLAFLERGLVEPDDVPGVVETLREAMADLDAAWRSLPAAGEADSRERKAPIDVDPQVSAEQVLAAAAVVGNALLPPGQTTPAVAAPEACRHRIEEMPFYRLVEADTELAEARRHYAEADPAERRLVAVDAYHRAEADRLWAQLGHQEAADADPWRAEVYSLAVDPDYAPAILTVGTLEYELGRRDEALALLGRLSELPEDTEDLAVIIEKAAGYLNGAGDVEAALALRAAAPDG